MMRPNRGVSDTSVATVVTSDPSVSITDLMIPQGDHWRRLEVTLLETTLAILVSMIEPRSGLSRARLRSGKRSEHHQKSQFRWELELRQSNVIIGLWVAWGISGTSSRL